MRTWRWLIVGCGSIGRRHIANLLAAGQQIVSVVDPDPDALRRSGETFGLSGAAHLDEGLAARPDVALIASPTSEHLAAAIAAANAGCHLWIEKPLADRLDGLEALIALVQARGLVSVVGCNMRFHPGPRLAHDALEAGKIGRPLSARFEAGSYLPSWRPGTDFRRSYSASAAQGGGCVLDGVHELDLACWMFGMPSEVMAMTAGGGALGTETETVAEILLRYPEELLVSIHLDYVQRWRQRRCEILGAEGTLSWESRRHEVAWYASQTDTSTRLGYEPSYDINQMYVDELHHVLRCLERQERSCADAAWGAQMTQLALAVKASARTGRAIPFDAPARVMTAST